MAQELSVQGCCEIEAPEVGMGIEQSDTVGRRRD